MEFTKDIRFSRALEANKTIEITYSGDLFKKQSDFVAIVYGFGENWEFTSEQSMTKTEDGFTTSIQMKDNFDTFNFCFRNGNYEWDNNQTFNYISTIQPVIFEEVTQHSQTISNEVIENSIDVDYIIEILDNILAENFSAINSDYTEAPEEIEIIDEKQQILEDILLETETSEKNSLLVEEFNMDELIENILNPVINFSSSEDNVETFESENISTFEEINDSLQETLNQEFKNIFEESEINTVEVNSTSLSETKENASENNLETALVPTSEDTYLVSPRKLRKFYMFAKKIKLAFYKLFVGIPKLLSGTFNEDKNN